MTTILIAPLVVVLAPQLHNATARRGARKQSYRQDPGDPLMITGRTLQAVR
jgi:hypothetical protein